MKEKFIKNKNKILIILAFILSLSGVVVLAEVTSKDDNNTAQEQEARMLEASILKSKDNDTDNVTDNLSSIDSQEEVNQNNDITQEDTKLETSSEEAAEQVVISSEDLEILAYEEALLIEKQIELDKAYQLEQAAINAKIVPNKYKEVSFNKIGTQSAADVQIGISTANNFVNIRELPSEEGKVLGKLYNNEAAAILSVENGWALIESGSVKGYVTTEYLNMDLTKDEVVESVG
ncbi:MAG: SH3 domain-containing protein, partial [Clostridiales bacterium]|nr:SH3 domain-containing protein [Clostridiales bacterium]